MIKILLTFIVFFTLISDLISNNLNVEISSSDLILIKENIKQQPVIRGIHLTSWVAGSDKKRRDVINKIKNSVINTVVVAIREKNGEIYIPGVENAIKYKTYVAAIPKPKEVVKEFKDIGLYTIARVVCFHDDILPKKNPDWAVKDVNGGVWKTKNGNTWLDPYNNEVWNYILEVAIKAAEYGFDEIQFDYIRYPTEGNTKNCRFSKIHNKENATQNIVEFIKYAREKLSRYNVKISADVFGLTTRSEMGIGQDLASISKVVDRVYPMMYPSHYYKGEYGLYEPENEPYKVINRGLKEALKITGKNYYKVIPYLQDFSLKIKYTPYHVRAQILATKNNLIDSFLLWNPASIYSWELLKPEVFCSLIEPDKCNKR
ncbi:MAG: putative glycoside hydrolase [Elusimicrobiales bacterium]|nr:putative glycoside hydrolase [Elusimicrobiales bacterium]